MSVGWLSVTVGALGVLGSMDAAKNADHANRQSIAAAEEQGQREQEMQKEMLDYYRGRDAQSAALQAQANAIAGRVANSQVALMDQQRRQSGEYFDRLKETFWPLEDGLVKDAEEYDTPERRMEAMSRAMADVGQQYGMARDVNSRELTRMGVNPNSGAYSAAMNSMTLGEASAKAAASRQANDQIENMGWARRYDTAALGRNLPSNSTAAASAASSAGQAATSAAYAPVNAFNAATQITGSGLMNAGQLGSGASSMLMNAYNNQANAWAGASSGLGSMGGSLIGTGLANLRNSSSGSGAAAASGGLGNYSLAGQGARLSAW